MNEELKSVENFEKRELKFMERYTQSSNNRINGFSETKKHRKQDFSIESSLCRS